MNAVDKAAELADQAWQDYAVAILHSERAHRLAQQATQEVIQLILTECHIEINKTEIAFRPFMSMAEPVYTGVVVGTVGIAEFGQLRVRMTKAEGKQARGQEYIIRMDQLVAALGE